MSKKLKRFKHGYVLVYEHKAFAVMYNVIDTTNMDRSTWTEEQKKERKNFMTMLVLKVWPHAVKKEFLSKLPKGQVQVLEFKDFDTLLECKDWAIDRWDNRDQADWFDELNTELNYILKDRFIQKGVLQ